MLPSETSDARLMSNQTLPGTSLCEPCKVGNGFRLPLVGNKRGQTSYRRGGGKGGTLHGRSQFVWLVLISLGEGVSKRQTN